METAAFTIERRRIEITGRVQGVGFRPWVYRLAAECGVGGAVWNSTSGVTIEAEAASTVLDAFLARLARDPPPLARIESLSVSAAVSQESAARQFRILPSRAASAVPAQVAPDTAPCDRCREDYRDPQNRRAGYAFTNCTHCGPRYTITHALPYDRARTTMAGFAMCGSCQTEYDAPIERRFHAQPNACGDCGPALSCDQLRGAEALAWAASRTRAGAIVAIKNVGGYQLACDATNEATVQRLRAAKQRPRKPFALLAADLATVEKMCHLSAAEGEALRHPARPIVLLRRRTGEGVAASVAPGQNRLGVMLPSSPLHELLLETCGLPLLVMTSGNRGAEPLAAEEGEAGRNLEGIAEVFLDHNRPIQARLDDSIVQYSSGAARSLRRARGYVPEPIALGEEGASVWAAGAELKNTFCLTRGAQAFLSPHIGDMANLETWRFYQETFRHYLKLFDFRPAALAVDAHPGYLLNRWVRRLAAELDVAPVIEVQHHHAHIAACMAEHQMTGSVLGIAWDGTGYGSDATVWGGEFLRASRAGFERVGHFRPIAMVGGDQAVREPWRLGLAYLRQALGDEALTLAQTLWPGLDRRRLQMVWALLGREERTPGLRIECSSAGRLFDAVAALLGLAPEGEPASFEGEAALAVQNAAERCREPAPPYRFDIHDDEGLILDFAPMIAALVADRLSGNSIETLAERVHATLTLALVAMCRHLRASCGNRICLGGGVFQNQLLLESCESRLRAAEFEVFSPRQAPANDGGLALGQAVVAQSRLRGEG
ncbi:MAG: carbamoyltransferase HypF [Terriglobales bacterium]